MDPRSLTATDVDPDTGNPYTSRKRALLIQWADRRKAGQTPKPKPFTGRSEEVPALSKRL